MEHNDTYLTISSNAEGIFKDKGSKFIAYAYPVHTEEQIKVLVQNIKKEHYSARHHCYAYRLGYKGENFRANDDGEPSGTAGKPILNQLLSANLTNTLIVVVRYFGGTLLGVSGLINAYKHATIDALQHATIISEIIENLYHLEFEYPLQNAVMRVIKDENLTVLKTNYETNCLLEVSIRLNKTDIALNKFSKIEGLKVSEVE
jgi:uncharacterized YigZ family protein